MTSLCPTLWHVTVVSDCVTHVSLHTRSTDFFSLIIYKYIKIKNKSAIMLVYLRLTSGADSFKEGERRRCYGCCRRLANVRHSGGPHNQCALRTPLLGSVAKIRVGSRFWLNYVVRFFAVFGLAASLDFWKGTGMCFAYVTWVRGFLLLIKSILTKIVYARKASGEEYIYIYIFICIYVYIFSHAIHKPVAL